MDPDIIETIDLAQRAIVHVTIIFWKYYLLWIYTFWIKSVTCGGHVTDLSQAPGSTLVYSIVDAGVTRVDAYAPKVTQLHPLS